MNAQEARELLFNSVISLHGKMLEQIQPQIQACAEQGKHQLMLEYTKSIPKDTLNGLVQFFTLNGYYADLIEAKSTVTLLIDWDARGYTGDGETTTDAGA